jgi:hypothetical protein
VEERQKIPGSSTKTTLYVDEKQKIAGSSTKTALYVDGLPIMVQKVES